jgi:hypothetical protein
MEPAAGIADEPGITAEPAESTQRAPRPYIRSRAAARTAVTSATAVGPRPSRALITDYGYVVSELKRIGLTFGGLVVLLVILSRRLH